MSEAGNSVFSVRPAGGGSVSGDGGEERNKSICMWFERKLCILKYARDGKDERVRPYDRYIQVNSKILRASYDIPAEKTYRLLKSIHEILLPQAKKSGGATKLALNNWKACSDFTVRVLPQSPAVLWMDVECLKCKAKEKRIENRRHYSSHELMKTVVEVVRRVTDRSFDSFYVTQGRTCGVHFFFDSLVLPTVDDVAEVWYQTNRRLREKGQDVVTVDTGCSAMPLPLARRHNMVARVQLEPGRTGGGMVLSSKIIDNPSLEDLIAITNFSHYIREAEKAPQAPGSVASSCVLSVRHLRDQGFGGGSEPVEDRAEVLSCTDDGAATVVGEPATVVEAVEEPAPAEDAVEEQAPAVGVVEEGAPAVEVVGGELVAAPEIVGEDRKRRFDEVETDDPPGTTTGSLNVKRRRTSEDDKEEGRGGDHVAPVCAEGGTQLPGDCPGEPMDQEVAVVVCGSPRPPSPEVLEGVEETESRPSSPREQATTIACDDAASSIFGCRQTESSLIVPRTPAATTLFGSMSGSEDDIDDGGSAKLPVKDLVPAPGHGPGALNDGCTETYAALFVGRLPSILKHHHGGDPVDAVRRGFQPRPQSQPPQPPPQQNRPTQSTSRPNIHIPSDCDPEVIALYTPDDTPPPHARLPLMHFTTGPGRYGATAEAAATNRAGTKRRRGRDKEWFSRDMRLRLDDRHGHAHETDMQIIQSTFSTEYDFYVSSINNSTPVETNDGRTGLRVKSGGSLHLAREHCPAALFQEYVPHVLYNEDYVSEFEWISVLVRYFDEYLNDASVLYVMSRVLHCNNQVKDTLSPDTLQQMQVTVYRCLTRFRIDAMGYQMKADRCLHGRLSKGPRHPYEDKCTVAVGLLAICSSAFKMVTAIFTDLAKTCRLLLGNYRRTVGTLNTSTVSGNDTADTNDNNNNNNNGGGGSGGDGGADIDVDVDYTSGPTDQDDHDGRENTARSVPPNLGNDHTVLASLLRWNYAALSDQTLWCLFFYYHHVHADGLTRILTEVAHGGLMVTALLQAYLEEFAENKEVDIRLVAQRWRYLCAVLDTYVGPAGSGDDDDDEDEERRLMPPPKGRGPRQQQKRKMSGGPRSRKQAQSNRRGDKSKKAAPSYHGKELVRRTGRREDCGGYDDEDDDDDQEDDCENDDAASTASGGAEEVKKKPGYDTSPEKVLWVLVHRYLRPISVGDKTLVYMETGYMDGEEVFNSSFANKKETKKDVMDVFTRATLRYVMPHGDLLMYDTDVADDVHRWSTLTNNLVLNIFENMYGGCITFLTRRYNNNLKLHRRFHGAAYKLVVECRHAMHGLIQSIELSYINLILRQPVVPPVLEHDLTVRHMYMSGEEIKKGAFVCLNANDYVRAVNMFTRHSKFAKDNCRIADAFLNGLITDHWDGGTPCDGGDMDGATRTRFRTLYLFFLLYMFEVMYKIRHAYHRDRTYHVSTERLSWDMDVRLLLKLFFGTHEFVMPQGLAPETLRKLEMPTDLYDGLKNGPGDGGGGGGGGGMDDLFAVDVDGCDGAAGTGATRCVNTRPVVSTVLPDKIKRMIELFGKKGIAVVKSYAPLDGDESDPTSGRQEKGEGAERVKRTQEKREAKGDVSSTPSSSTTELDNGVASAGGEQDAAAANTTTTTTSDTSASTASCTKKERTYLDMAQPQLEEALYSPHTWYDACAVRVEALHAENAKAKARGKRARELEMSMDADSVDTFLRTQLRVNIDNDRLGHVEKAVRAGRDFDFCKRIPLRTKITALVLAAHAVKRITPRVAEDFTDREYSMERTGAVKFRTRVRFEEEADAAGTGTDEEDGRRPDLKWSSTWANLLGDRRSLLTYCRRLADTHFPDNYFVGLAPEKTYQSLYSYMVGRADEYTTLRKLRDETWAQDVCAALNYLLVMNGYDPELVELCLRLFLGFEWPGQWAKRIFVWKSNSNAGKSFFFEHVISKAFDKSTCINDPKGGKDNAPEKAEYYKNFVLMINEFNTVSASELKKLCSTSSYKFRMNYGNQMIQAFMMGKMVFNCNSLPMTTDHATIQRVALVPLPFWFQKRQTVVDSLLNWTRGGKVLSEYEKNFKRKVSQLLTEGERRFFIDNPTTKNEDDLFNKPNDISLQLFSKIKEYSGKSSTFLVQNKTSQVYMASGPPTGQIISGIITATKYFCRFRFFNNIKEPVDYSVIPATCVAAAQEWLMVSQPYFDWKERYNVRRDDSVHTKVSAVHASLQHFAKNYAKSVSFFDLRQFFEFDFADDKIPFYNAKEDEYYVRLDPIE